MSRINQCSFRFATPAAGQLSLWVDHPLAQGSALRFDDAALSAILTPAQRTALGTLLGIVFAQTEIVVKAIAQARRDAMDTDP